ncbi:MULTISPECIES: DUF488 domain-containing protein [Marinobacter]|jgi:uncharacterized protein YeaO (DUF488 family)|uniref:DUF488 domain-containing protein n=1 Tax=Marinobacter TaxID=2742 RepID=UPI000FC9A92C|nr:MULTISPECIES: DUF488 family protein [Marinobacter]MDM8180946.1 DUF488 family protein [Marinobacter salarius]RUT74273.1 DUF488 family protein [Marinobacter sp. NP-6]
MTEIRLKRAYDEPAGSDGPRLLVDRVWPRGVAKEKGSLAEWLKDLAPSTELRKWFGHDPARWDGFREKYLQELASSDRADLRTLASYVDKHERITLVFAAKDTDHNNAVALKQFIEASELPV